MADKLSRRDFLKVAGAALGGVLLPSVLESCSPRSVEKEPAYFEIDANDELMLNVQGREGVTKVIIYYPGFPLKDAEKLQVRQVDGKSVYLPFQNGASRIRMVGEILEPVLFKVRKSSQLPEGTEVAVYVNASPPTGADTFQRRKLPEGDDVFGLPVITARMDWLQDGNSLFEINAKTPAEAWMNLSQFGKGYAVGQFSQGERGYGFGVVGYVLDGRALEVVK